MPPHLPGKRPPADCTEACEAARRGRAGRAALELARGRSRAGSALSRGHRRLYPEESARERLCLLSRRGLPVHQHPIGGQGDGVPARRGHRDNADPRRRPGDTGDHLTLGGRLGFVLRGGSPLPDGDAAHAFLPLHVEARGSYWFGEDAFTRKGMRLCVPGGGHRRGRLPFRGARDRGIEPLRPPSSSSTTRPIKILTPTRRRGAPSPAAAWGSSGPPRPRAGSRGSSR